MAGGGTEQGLQVHLQKALDSIQSRRRDGAAVPVMLPMPPPKARLNGKDFGPGTPNHKGLRLVCDLVDEAPGSILRLADFLAVQEERGHCCAAMAIETNTASHGQLHAAWAGVAYLWFARHEQVNTGLLRWWWSFFALCAACEIPGAKYKPYPEPLVWGPGWRAKIKEAWVASNPARDLCYSLMMGAAHPGEEGEPYRRRLPARNRKLWRDKYNNGPRALALLKPGDLAALLPPPGWVPPLPYPFHLWRFADGAFAAWFEAPEGNDLAPSAGWNRTEKGWIHERTVIPGVLGQEAILYPATSFERS